MESPKDNKNFDQLIVKTSNNDEISIEKATYLDSLYIKKYKEVLLNKDNIFNSNISRLFGLSNLMTFSEINKLKGQGYLYTSRISPETYSKLKKDGSCSTIIIDSKGIKEHVGYNELDTSKLQALKSISLGMKAMSFVSGEYYLSQINNQINEINKKLEELIKIHHNENIGKLFATRKTLSDISNRMSLDSIDLNSIRSCKKTSDEVFQEYFYSLNSKQEDVRNLKNEKEIISKIDDINFDMSLAFEANKLSLMCQIVEVTSRLKLESQEEIVEELINQLKIDYEDSLYANISNQLQKLENSINYKLEEFQFKKKMFTEKIDKFGSITPGIGYGLLASLGLKTIAIVKENMDSSSILKSKNTVHSSIDFTSEAIEKIKADDQLDEIIENVLDLKNKKSTILYIPVDEYGEERIFIATEENQ